MTQHPNAAEDGNCKLETRDGVKDLSTWSVLDIGTGNGLLLHELAKQGYVVLFFANSCIAFMRHGLVNDTNTQGIPCLIVHKT